MIRYRHEVQLLNPTKIKWSLFKSIDRKIVNLVKKHGITTIKTFYKDDVFIKIVIFDDINDGKYFCLFLCCKDTVRTFNITI